MKHLAVAAFVLLGAMLVATQPAMAQTTPAKTAITIPVTGSGGGSTFAGTFQLQQFATSQGQVFANGLLSGIVTAANGTKTSVLQTVSMPVQVGTSTCQILHLDLGPLNLTLLGLQVSLNQIVLDITAQSGPGNLLGNLLCGVANLLNSPTSLVTLLNQILAAL
jgi:hypothetical protein